MPRPTKAPRAGLSRRHLLGAASLACLIPAAPAAAGTATELTVTEALRLRRSTRAFAPRPVEPALLAELLWAAFGVNRTGSGLRTAPSWRGATDITVFAATADGVFVFDPAAGTATPWRSEDIRPDLSTQPFVQTAPVVLVLVSDLRRLEAAGQDDQRRLYAMVDAAMVAENVYLFAAARHLGTCLVGGVERDRTAQALGLQAHDFPAFVQPVGWPA